MRRRPLARPGAGTRPAGPKARRWYEIKALGTNEAEIYIYDEIGDSWWSDSVSAKDFRDELAALGDVTAIALRINSPGGSYFDAVTIYNALVRHPATVTVYVDGWAASAASVVAMAEDRIVMPANTMMMIHNPIFLMYDAMNARDLRQAADALDKIGEAMTTTYAQRCTKTSAELLAALDAETWLTAADAADWGFCDVEADPLADDGALARFDVAALGFRNAPKAAGRKPVPVAVGRTLNADNEQSLKDAVALIEQAETLIEDVISSVDPEYTDPDDQATAEAHAASGDASVTMPVNELRDLLHSAFE